MIKIIRWPQSVGSLDFSDSMWVEQDGYEGAWLGENDKRYKKLIPVLDLLPPDNTDYDSWGVSEGWDDYEVYHLTMSEWDAITEGALLP